MVTEFKKKTFLTRLISAVLLFVVIFTSSFLAYPKEASADLLGEFTSLVTPAAGNIYSNAAQISFSVSVIATTLAAID